MYVSRTKFNYKITKNTAIITGTVSVNTGYKMLQSQCASKSVKSYCKCETDN